MKLTVKLSRFDARGDDPRNDPGSDPFEHCAAPNFTHCPAVDDSSSSHLHYSKPDFRRACYDTATLFRDFNRFTVCNGRIYGKCSRLSFETNAANQQYSQRALHLKRLRRLLQRPITQPAQHPRKPPLETTPALACPRPP